MVRQLAIEWTVDPAPTTLEHVRIDHRRGDILVAQEFLPRSRTSVSLSSGFPRGVRF